jgi:hypothetical protein
MSPFVKATTPLLWIVLASGCSRSRPEPEKGSSEPKKVELKSRAELFSSLTPTQLGNLPAWTVAMQERLERPRAAKAEIAKETPKLSLEEEKQCDAYRSWQVAVDKEKSNFERTKLYESKGVVERQCLEKLAVGQVDPPAYAVVSLELALSDYNFGSKGFYYEVRDPSFELGVPDGQLGGIIEPREGSRNFYHCEYNSRGLLYLHELTRSESAPPNSKPLCEKLEWTNFLPMPDEAKAKSLSDRVQANGKVSLDIAFKTLPYGKTRAMCQPRAYLQGLQLPRQRIEAWRGDPIGFRFKVDGKPLGEWQPFDGPETPS